MLGVPLELYYGSARVGIILNLKLSDLSLTCVWDLHSMGGLCVLLKLLKLTIAHIGRCVEFAWECGVLIFLSFAFFVFSSFCLNRLHILVGVWNLPSRGGFFSFCVFIFKKC